MPPLSRPPARIQRVDGLTATRLRIQKLVTQGIHMGTRIMTRLPIIMRPRTSEQDRLPAWPPSHPCSHSCSLLLPSMRERALVIHMQHSHPHRRDTSPLCPNSPKVPVQMQRCRGGIMTGATVLTHTREHPTRLRRFCGRAHSSNHCPASHDYPRTQASCNRWQL